MDSNTFLCTTCGSTFRERWELKCHNQKFHDTRVFNCQICNLEVIGLFKMQGHKNIHKKRHASSFVNYFDSIRKLHRMCTEEKLGENYEETIEEFKDAFENVHQLFGISETLKIHVISHHYSDYFKMTGKTFRETNGEHHEALHHTLKIMERNKNLYMKKNHGGAFTNKKATSQYLSGMC